MEASRDAAAPPPRRARRYTTISIPQPLYHEVKEAIEGTGFRSPTEFMVYVTRMSLQSRSVAERPLVAWSPSPPPRPDYARG